LNWFSFFILSLATWRIASLLARETGPFGIFTKLREVVGVKWKEEKGELIPYGENVISEAILCVWCSSVWIALILVLLTVRPFSMGDILIVLAISAASIVVDILVNR
jgi:hypothetical protein